MVPASSVKVLQVKSIQTSVTKNIGVYSSGFQHFWILTLSEHCNYYTTSSHITTVIFDRSHEDLRNHTADATGNQ